MSQVPAARPGLIRFDGFGLDVRSGELCQGTERIRLQEQCLQVLIMLLARPGEVVTRGELRARLWPHGTIVDFEHSVNAAIKRLREALGDSADNPRFIETIPRRGYRFLAKVQRDEQIGTSAPAAILERLNNRYELLEKVGAGGMGEVYLARDVRLERDVAIKVLPPAMVVDEAARRRLRKEALSLSRLTHPNVAVIFDFDADRARDFLVMEYVQGMTLSEKLADGPMRLNEVLEIGAQLCDGLDAAHSQGIIHRDLKPDNLKLSGDGRLKILDFGLAKLLARDDTVLETVSAAADTGFAGTPPYMAPEQIQGGTLDARTDIWAAGAVLYEMATGVRAFSASRRHLTEQILEREPSPPSRINPRIPPTLSVAILKCLNKDPTRRYQTVKELSLDLRWIATPTRRREFIAGIAALVVLLLVFVIIAWPLGSRRRQAINSVAVLPFTNVSNNTDGEYLSDGITESVINNLSQLPELRVIARSTVFRYRGKDTDPQRVGQDLHVGAVLTGRLQQRGDTIILQTELMDVANSSQLWGGQYVRKAADVFALQTDLSGEISERLRLKLTGEEKQRLAKRYTDSGEAYQLYLKGRYYLNRRSEEGFRKAVESFTEAIGKDPQYAPAYAALSESYFLMGSYLISPVEEVLPKARDAVAKALQLDDMLGEAHTSLAAIKQFYDWDWTGAGQEYRRALQLNPGYATGHQYYSDYLSSLGRHEEALAESQRAVELDPLSLIINSDAAQNRMVAGQVDAAIQQLSKALELDPNFAQGHFILGKSYLRKKDFAAAAVEIKKAMSLSSKSIKYVGALGQAYALGGRRNDAQRLLKELNDRSRQEIGYSWAVACIYAGLGDNDRALAALENAYKERVGTLQHAKVEPLLDPLRSDPRFLDLLRRIGLSP